MSMLEIHDAALVSINEARHLFLLRYKREAKAVYGIVEGKDDPMFYRGMIERFLPEDWSIELIPAGGRARVMDMLMTLDWSSIPRSQVAFFIDRDLTSLVGSDDRQAINLYTTDGYSIENDIVTADLFYRILFEVFNIVDATEEERHAIVHIFKSNLLIFTEVMCPIMAHILGWRKNHVVANLNNFDVGKMFKFDNGTLVPREEFTTREARIDHLCSGVDAQLYDDDTLAALEDNFKDPGSKLKFVRGKYLIWLLSASALAMHESISSYVAAYGKPPKLKMSVGPKNIMVVAAPRARIPSSLRLFIESTFLAFIKAKEHGGQTAIQ